MPHLLTSSERAAGTLFKRGYVFEPKLSGLTAHSLVTTPTITITYVVNMKVIKIKITRSSGKN
jgi:hypothetical protein